MWIPLSSPHKCQTSSQFSSPYQCEQPFSSTPHKRHHLTSVNPPVINSQVSSPHKCHHHPLPHCHHLTSVNCPSHQHLTSVITSQVWVLLSSPHKCQSSGTSRHEETWFWNRAISFVLNQVNMKFHNEHLKPSGNVLQAFSVTPSLCPNPASDAYDCHHSSFFPATSLSPRKQKHDTDFFLPPYFRPISFHFTLCCKNSFGTSIFISPLMLLCCPKIRKQN